MNPGVSVPVNSVLVPVASRGRLGVTRVDTLESFPWGVEAAAAVVAMVGTMLFVVAGVASSSSFIVVVRIVSRSVVRLVGCTGCQ